MELALGKWALVKSPSLLALLPLIIYLIFVFRNKSNLAGLVGATVVAAILTGQNLQSLAKLLAADLGSSMGVIGLIIMFGSGLGYLMNETRVSHTLVYWIVKKIGVNSENKGMLAIIITSIIICGLLGTLAGGNAVIAPVIIPVVAAVGLAPSTVTTLFKVSGEVGLMVGPLTAVTLATEAVCHISYGSLMLWAVIPFSLVWLLSTFYAAKLNQKKNRGIETYEITEDMLDINKIVITKKEKITTLIFIVSFLLLVVGGILTKQGTDYALIVMAILSIVIAICSRLEIDHALDTFAEGASKMTNMFFIFILFQVMFDLIDVGGGFTALGNLLKGLIGGGGKFAVMMVASLVGGFGIEAAAAAEINLVAKLFGGLAVQVHLPMVIFATTMLAATRITGAVYPTANLAGQMGIARCTNMKDALKAAWIGAAALWIWVIVWSLVGPIIAG